MLYKLTKRNSKMRSWEINTRHGILKTPVFMPDATYGTVHTITTSDLERLGIKALVTTTLHIEQKIGSVFLKKFGGLHKFMSWEKPILTDSGGWQVFSLINRGNKLKNRLSNAGASFTNVANGEYSFLSPEISQVIQHNIGSDIRIVLDEPVLEDSSLKRIKECVDRNTAWAMRAKKEFLLLNNLTEKDYEDKKIARPLLTCVIQGGNSLKYRKLSFEALHEIGFDIYGFGGLPLHSKYQWNYNSPQGFYKELIQFIAELIPDEKIRYGLGIGTPDNLKYAIMQGYDLFDSVLPTRNARHSYIYASPGIGDTQYENYSVLHIKSLRYANDPLPVDPKCNCLTCRTISRAYLRYLLKIKNPTGFRYATIHNLYYYQHFIDSVINNAQI